MNRFAEVTLLHGLGHVYQSIHVLERVIFVLCIIGSATMICRDAILLVNKFNSEPTTVSLTIMHNDSITIKPTFCFLPDTFAMNPERDFRFPSFSYDVINSKDQIIAFDLSEGIESVKTDWIDLTKTYNDWVIQDKTQWWSNHKAGFTLIYLMLGEIMKWEYTRTHDTPLALYQISFFSPSLLSSLRQIQKILLDQHMDFDKLTKFVARVLCTQVLGIHQFTQNISGVPTATYSANKYLSTGTYDPLNANPVALYLSNTSSSNLDSTENVSEYDKTHKTPKDEQFSDSICDNGKLSYFGGTDASVESLQICYQYPMDLTFGKISDNIVFQFVYDSINNKKTSACQAYINLMGDRAYLMAENTDSSIQICGGQKIVKANVAYDVFSYNKRSDPCTSRARVDCVLLCRENYLIDKCKCFPIGIFSDSPKPAGIPHCSQIYNITETSTTLDSCVSDSKLMKRCTDACGKECHTRKLNLLYVYDPPKDFSFKNFTLFFTSFIYPKFEENILMIWSDYIMAFGGSIGFWMGGSIIAFLHIPIYLFRIGWIKMCTKRKRESQTSIDSISVPLPRAS